MSKSLPRKLFFLCLALALTLLSWNATPARAISCAAQCELNWDDCCYSHPSNCSGLCWNAYQSCLNRCP